MCLKEKYTELIKAEAKRLGFFACGISKVRVLEEERENMQNWLNKNYNADLKYMENNFEMRLNPALLVENAKSVISLLFSYYPEKIQQTNDNFLIAKYAYGEDYHFVLKDKMMELFDFINDKIEKISGRIFVDSAPVLERKWAQLSGLGWIGKNTNLLTKNGSFFFISELIIDLYLEPDLPITKNYCGTCTLCIDACPTNALIEPYFLDSRKCISYLTIENKNEISSDFKNKFENRIFGCDICQDVCPYNKKAIITNENRFDAKPELLQMNKDNWKNITLENFNTLFKKSALKRAKFSGLIRNIGFSES